MHTTLSIINLDSREGTLELRFMSEYATQVGETRTLQIPGNGKLFIDDPEFFTKFDSERITSGYVKVVSDGVRLAGSTVFGHSDGRSYTAALPLIRDLQDSVIFSHVASSDILYTGLAIVNPGNTGADAVIQLYAVDGSLIDETSVYIPAGEHRTKVLTEFFPSLIGKEQCNGHIRIISNTPLASFALFGTTNMSVLSAIPPKAVQ